MNVPAVAALIRRRGSVIGWQQATAVDPSLVDPLTLGPTATLGGPRPVGQGPSGTTYGPVLQIIAYFSKKNVSAVWQSYGIVESGDAQLDVAVPFVPAEYLGVVPLAPGPLAAYNAGKFSIIQGTGDDTPPTFDRFIVAGNNWVAKAPPVPLIDANVTMVWRILISRESVL